MNTARKGNRQEKKSRALLEAMGYRCTESRRSLGEWDLVCIGTHDVVLCQVKSRDFPGTMEKRALQDFEVPPCVRKIIHRWRDGRRLPDVLEL